MFLYLNMMTVTWHKIQKSHIVLWYNFIISPLATHFNFPEAAMVFHVLCILGDPDHVYTHDLNKYRPHTHTLILCLLFTQMIENCEHCGMSVSKVKETSS